jgi:hypothetical protein
VLYRIEKAIAHPDHTVTVTWSDGVTAVVDLAPVVAKGKVFAPMQGSCYFVEQMRVADDRLGLEWANRVDFSADGLRFRAFPAEADDEFGASSAIFSAPSTRTTRFDRTASSRCAATPRRSLSTGLESRWCSPASAISGIEAPDELRRPGSGPRLTRCNAQRLMTS